MKLLHSAVAVFSMHRHQTMANSSGNMNKWACMLFLSGNVLFAGSIYALCWLRLRAIQEKEDKSAAASSDKKKGNKNKEEQYDKSKGWRRVLGPLTPVGGLLYVGGWVLLAVA